MKLLVIDNYDSFTYNLVETLRQLGQADIQVVRNDHIPFSTLHAYDAALLSPGPGIPAEAPGMIRLLAEWPADKPLLGICLGLQAITEHFGGRLRNLGRVYHGMATEIHRTTPADPILDSIPQTFTAGRYHSWVADPAFFPAELEITAQDEAGHIMALRHRSRPVYGLQFHPESILTPHGPDMLHNFLRTCIFQPEFTLPPAPPAQIHGSHSAAVPLNQEQADPQNRAPRNAHTIPTQIPMKGVLEKLHAYMPLDTAEAYQALTEIATGTVPPAQIAAFLGTYCMRPVTVAELRGFRQALLEKCLPADLGTQPLLDLCGTGGDGRDTFNISTLAAFITAGAGIPVAKHGNYGVSSVCGSSDLMQALGYTFTADSSRLQRELETAGICFLHAPLFHPAMKAAAPVRRELGFKTFFNMLGPLVNPARPQAQCTGVYSLELARLYQYLLEEEGIRFTLLHSTDGYDEASLTSTLHVIQPGSIQRYAPEDLQGLRVVQQDLYGGKTIAEAAQLFTRILNGAGTPAQNAVVTTNAAFAIQTAQGGSFSENLHRAQESLHSGAALLSFQKLLSAQHTSCIS